MNGNDNLSEYLQDLSRYPRLTHEQICQCARERDAGDPTAVNRIVEGNLPLVVSVAKRFRWSGVPLTDLVQAGSPALLRAAKRFDPDLGFQFSTLATGAIKREIARAAHELPAIVHIPLYMKGVEGLPRAFNQTDAESFGPGDDEDPTDFLDFVGAGDDPEFEVIDREDEHRAKLAAISKAVGMLNPRAQAIVRARMNGETLISIGDKLQITRERVRQIEERSMQLVRAYANMLLEAS